MADLNHMWSSWLILPISSLPRRGTFWYMVNLLWSILTALYPNLKPRLPIPSRDCFEAQDSDSEDILDSVRIKDLKQSNDHELAQALINLIEKDGAGAWPPRANHDSWPIALRAYKDIYLELASLLSIAEVSLDNEVNRARIENYRLRMRDLLADRVDIASVRSILETVEAGSWEAFTRDAYNGFYACMAVCRHAYRWATIPVVKVAQEEKTVNFPLELDVPWPYLQRTFGVTADSGNVTSNMLHNINEKGERVYKINVGMSDLIQSSEEVFARMFYDVEVMAFPIYHEMVRAILAFDNKDRLSCVKHLENISKRLRYLLLVFFEGLTDARVSRSVWLSYVQGFQGWGIGKVIDEAYVKYDGLSGNQVLCFQALDAFLGMDRYLPDESHTRYIPEKQRALCLAFRNYSFRTCLKENGDLEIEEKMKAIVNQLKMFRAAHRARAMQYLSQSAPERLPMTAGKSVLGATEEEGQRALKVLYQMLARRLKETV